MTTLTLVSHVLCPYVQRASIVLAEKNIPFERIDIDLANKPDWFLKVSPLGKTPVLLVNGEAIFESSVICEYLEDTALPSLHPKSPFVRAQHRAWMEFGSAILNNIGGFYSAANPESLDKQTLELRRKFEQIEAAIAHDGIYFSGHDFCMVDAVFGPIFRYFDVFDEIADFGVFSNLEHVQRWRDALCVRPSVKSAVASNYGDLLKQFLIRRQSELSKKIV
jgi:glutathione S-transferase